MKAYVSLTALICAVMILFPLSGITMGKGFSHSGNTAEEENSVRVFLCEENEIYKTQIEEYLLGAVAAEMPAEYEPEALKAQTVACYSYLLWLRKNSDNPEEAFDITDNASVHQGFLTDEEMKKKWGNKYESYREKILLAIRQVQGEYLTFGNEAILPLYHKLSPGMTQNSEDIRQQPLEYIKSVAAPGDKLSPNFDSSLTVKCEKIISLLELKQSSDYETLIDVSVLSSSRFVREIPTADKVLSAGDIASVLGLASPYFTAEYQKEKQQYCFYVKGIGHGLGMSQYSADYMARQGSSYDEILRHFYQGVTIRK